MLRRNRSADVRLKSRNAPGVSGTRHSWLIRLRLANVLHKIGREDEAVELDKRVEAIRLRYPQGSIRCSLRATVRPIKRSLRWRVSTFVSLILHPSRFQSNSR